MSTMTQNNERHDGEHDHERTPLDTYRITPSDAVASRAYERFLERGSEHGHDVDDWLEAERELAVTRVVDDASASHE